MRRNFADCANSSFTVDCICTKPTRCAVTRPAMFALFLLLLSPIIVFGCSWEGNIVVNSWCTICLMHQTPTNILTDVSIPPILTVVESYSYTNCDYTMTATQSVSINNDLFTADLVTFTFSDPNQPLFVTFQYPEVTITSLTASETLIFVHSFFSIVTDDLASGCYWYGSRRISSKWTWTWNVVFLQ